MFNGPGSEEKMDIGCFVRQPDSLIGTGVLSRSGERNHKEHKRRKYFHFVPLVLPVVSFSPLKSGGFLQGTMVVAMGIMRVVKVSTDHIVHVVAVGSAFMSAVRSMSMFGSVSFALMVGRAFVRVGTTYRETSVHRRGPCACDAGDHHGDNRYGRHD